MKSKRSTQLSLKSTEKNKTPPINLGGKLFPSNKTLPDYMNPHNSFSHLPRISESSLSYNQNAHSKTPGPPTRP